MYYASLHTYYASLHTYHANMYSDHASLYTNHANPYTDHASVYTNLYTHHASLTDDANVHTNMYTHHASLYILFMLICIHIRLFGALIMLIYILIMLLCMLIMLMCILICIRITLFNTLKMLIYILIMPAYILIMIYMCKRWGSNPGMVEQGTCPLACPSGSASMISLVQNVWLDLLGLWPDTGMNKAVWLLRTSFDIAPVEKLVFLLCGDENFQRFTFKWHLHDIYDAHV